ncbi:glucuronate isomerase [Glaciecola sp. KUL10]|uniref:glucuronate isomerase n=1 Tax=Glaciecola sp. (strain KUL10) TaxID=2161813 RepID=UPI000D78572A|nr:glucuronate isomerase [Glaciecola sp. KUL10]GBL05964.1 glucuronate isomerase [Glaciecola sp. KUL10]
MSKQLHLDEMRLFPAESNAREICKRLYSEVKGLPIISPHGHTDPSWFANNDNFENATSLLLTPDHYVLRMLYSQGISMQQLGIKSALGGNYEQDPRKVWRLFANNYHLFRGTPSRLWLDYVFAKVFGFTERLDASTADLYFDRINQQLSQDAFKPRALFERYNIEVISTTESPLDDLRHHQKILKSDWQGRVISAFRPDPVVDPDFEGFNANIDKLAQMTGEHCGDFDSYIKALLIRRAYFISTGVTASDHGHPSAATADLSPSECANLYLVVRSGHHSAEQAELFRAQMLTEMAKMSIKDGLIMQIHPGSFRNHNPNLFEHFGRDKGADIPMQIEFVNALKPLLDKYGNHPQLSIILFTLDETVYSRELAPLAGHYPAIKLGPSWWFHDSPEGMRRFRQQVTETAGFYNTVGFNDDTRAFLSIPARHDVARRMDCNFLSQLVAEHRLDEDEAFELAHDLSYGLAKKAYKL